jgi:hypothetical protein
MGIMFASGSLDRLIRSFYASRSIRSRDNARPERGVRQASVLRRFQIAQCFEHARSHREQPIPPFLADRIPFIRMGSSVRLQGAGLDMQSIGVIGMSAVFEQLAVGVLIDEGWHSDFSIEGTGIRPLADVATALGLTDSSGL